METVILIENLTKFYGKYQGVTDLNFEVKEGEVFGYLGPNGAGKTTTIRSILGFIKPKKGKIFIFGKDIEKEGYRIKKKIGYIPGDLALYENLTGMEFLKYMANLRGNVNWNYVKELSERFNINLNQFIRSLSHGNKQKIGIIQAFMHKPDLLILDEPTLGLDPLMQYEFYHLISEVKREGETVFLSSHILPEVERICDRVGIIREGKLVTVESIDTLKSHAFRELEVHFAKPVPKEAFSELPGIKDLKVENSIIRFKIVGSLDAVIKTAAHYEIVNIISHEPSLEEIFMSFYRGEGK
jgi:ABC-2 type transport system ATP-binding protein